MSSALAAPAAPPKYRPLAFGVTRATLHETMDGTQYLMAEQPLQAFGDRMSDRLLHWARATPDTTFIAQRVRGADDRFANHGLDGWQVYPHQAYGPERGRAAFVRGIRNDA